MSGGLKGSFSQGLLTGKVRISAESRLKINNTKKNTPNEATDVSGEDKVKKIKYLIELAGDSNKFENLRMSKDNQEVFGTFVN